MHAKLQAVAAAAAAAVVVVVAAIAATTRSGGAHAVGAHRVAHEALPNLSWFTACCPVGAHTRTPLLIRRRWWCRSTKAPRLWQQSTVERPQHGDRRRRRRRRRRPSNRGD